MTIRHVLATSALALSLIACSAEQAPVAVQPASEPESAPAATPAAPAATETQAFYGDEAPVAVQTPIEEDHGHAHDADGGHANEDEGEHAHDAQGEHVDESDAHDHGDGSEPHDH